jgi:hypothetical protein
MLSVPQDLVRKARAKAILLGTSLSAVVREFLEKWVENGPQIEGEDKDD